MRTQSKKKEKKEKTNKKTKTKKKTSPDLVLPRGWVSPGAGDVDGVLSKLLHLHVAEVADHVRQEVECGVAHLVQQLLTHRAPRHQAARVGGLGQHKLAVRAALDDGEAYVVPGQRENKNKGGLF